MAPDPAGADVTGTPGFFWWGLSCLSRPGAVFEALVQDLEQFRRHESGLERRWEQLVSRRDRLARGFKGRRAELTETGVGEAAGLAASAALAVPGLGLLLLVGKWGVQRGQQELRDGKALEVVPLSAGG